LTPFPDSELPPGYFGAELTVLSPSQMQQFAEFGLAGAVAGLTVQIPSGEQGNQIDYLAFPSADAAQQAFDAAQDAMPRRGLAWVGGCTPTQANGGTLFSGYLEAATSVCVSWVGNVIVLGSSVMPGFAEDQTMTNATDLARSGVDQLGLLLANDPPPAVPSLPDGTVEIVEIRGPGGFQDTGVPVNSGDTVTVRYLSGVWSTVSEFQNAPLTAAGDLGSPSDFHGSAVEFPYGALIGRIGETAPFGIGMDLTFQAENTGPLRLGMNDRDTSDNSGQIRVAIGVQPGLEPVPTATPIPAPIPPEADVIIELRDVCFESSTITLPATTDVVNIAFPNSTFGPLDSESSELRIETGEVQPGETVTMGVLDLPTGEYAYSCGEIVGTVVVQ
jgi:hypothetical protein